MQVEFEALRLRSRPKKVVFGPPICLPQILDMRFQIALTSEHVPNFR